MHTICSVCSFMTLFNDLNLKIMKLTLYVLQKINYYFYFFHISCQYMPPVDIAHGSEQFELF